jgi:hypothetical protein
VVAVVVEAAPVPVPVLDVPAHVLVEAAKFLIGLKLIKTEKNGLQSLAKTFPKHQF